MSPAKRAKSAVGSYGATNADAIYLQILSVSNFIAYLNYIGPPCAVRFYHIPQGSL